MKYDIKFNEWQEMSLKKDIEKIVSLLKKKQSLETSVLWEAFLAFLAMALDHTGFLKKIPHGETILLIFAIIPLLSIVILKLKQANENYKAKKTFQRAKTEFVDEFDNKVSYWVMTASSFCDALNGRKSELEKSETDESIPFLFQEANFYVNKSIDKIFSMEPSAGVVFNADVSRSKLIDAYRLETVIRILKQVREQSYSLAAQMETSKNISVSGSETIMMQKKSDKIYDDIMRNVLKSDEIQRVLGKKIEW